MKLTISLIQELYPFTYSLIKNSLTGLIKKLSIDATIKYESISCQYKSNYFKIRIFRITFSVSTLKEGDLSTRMIFEQFFNKLNFYLIKKETYQSSYST